MSIWVVLNFLNQFSNAGTIRNCFTVECGSPGMLKSMSASVLSRIFLLSVLSVPDLMKNLRVVLYCNVVSLTGRPVLSWICSTLRLLLSSEERAWILITSCVISGCPDLSEDQDSSLKALENGTFIFHFLNNYHVLRVIRLPWSITNLDLGLVGLVGWILLVEQLLLVAVEQLLPLLVVDQLLRPNSFVQSWR